MENYRIVILFSVICSIIVVNLTSSTLPKMDHKDAWIARAQKHGYEGAALLLTKNGEMLFLLSAKDGKQQAEVAGGKIEDEDNGDPLLTAIRELREEVSIQITPEEAACATKLTTTGGTTGQPAYQFLLECPGKEDPVPQEKFTGFLWSKIKKAGSDYVTEKGDIPIRKFNRYFIDQNAEALSAYFA